MRATRRFFWIVAIRFVVGAVDAAGQEVSIDDLLQMWSQRQLATETVEFRWVEKVASAGKGVTYDCSLRLGIESRIRSDRIPSAKRRASDEYLTQAELAVSSFDGNRNRYFTSASGLGDHHRAIEFDAEHYDEIVNYHLRAILLAYRPLCILPSAYSSKDDKLVRSDAKLAIVEQAVLDGVPCVIVDSQTNEDAMVRQRYWIDTTRQGLILKHVEFVGDRQTTELVIKYKNDLENGWFPLLWHSKVLNTAVEGRVTKYEIGKDIDSKIFQIEYPNGTVVFDRDLSTRERVQADGSRSPIEPARESK